MLEASAANHRTLALDLGGTAVKAGLYLGDCLERTASWPHSYKDSTLPQARDHLLRETLAFCDGSVDTIGLSIAGLIASDGSLFRSTVLTALEDENIGELLKRALNARTCSVNNDADCGAMGEFYFARHELFYVVLGSGAGSNYVNSDGSVRYLVRVDRSRPYTDEMNHPLSDIGLKIFLSRDRVYEIFAEHRINPAEVDRVLFPEYENAHRGLLVDRDKILLGRLGSAVGVGNCLEILWKGNLQLPETRLYYQGLLSRTGWSTDLNLDELFDRRRAAKIVAHFARQGEPLAVKAYQLMGVFLGMVLSEAQKILYNDLGRFGSTHIGGPILAAGNLFLNETRRVLRASGVECVCTPAHSFLRGENANLRGAFLCANREGLAGDANQY